MDIQYLLTLQGLRESLPDPIETFFVLLSVLGDGPALVALVCIVYWCVDKRAGQFTFFALSAASFAGQLLKNIVCAYRPWVRDATVSPAEKAIESVDGYSFPSGHTIGAMSAFGSFAWLARKKHGGIVVLCIFMIVVVAFSRNFLGVHTPQDVLGGLLIGLIAIALTQLFFNWIERWDAIVPHHNKDVVVMVVVIVACALAVAFVLVKPYPMDYIDGELIVDPVTMQKGLFEVAGMFAGAVVAWVLERRFVGFSTEELDLRTRVIRGVVGVGLVGIAYVATDVVFKALLPYNWAKLFAMFVVVVVAIFVAPLVFGKLERNNR